MGNYRLLGSLSVSPPPPHRFLFASPQKPRSHFLHVRRRPSVAGLAAGATEAIAVVSPMEVIKIRLQAQHHSLADPDDIPKYRSAAHCAYTTVKEEGVRALYRGVSLTALRQATNQGRSCSRVDVVSLGMQFGFEELIYKPFGFDDPRSDHR